MISPIYYSFSEENLYITITETNMENINQQVYIWNEQRENEILAQLQIKEALKKITEIEEYVYQSSHDHLCMQKLILKHVEQVLKKSESLEKLMHSEIKSLAKQVKKLKTEISRHQVENQKHNIYEKTIHDEMLRVLHATNHETKQINKIFVDFDKELKQLSSTILQNQNGLEHNLIRNLRYMKESILSNNEALIAEIKKSVDILQDYTWQQKRMLDEHQRYHEKQVSDIQRRFVEIKELMKEESPYKFFKRGNRITIIDKNGNKYSGVFIEDTENEIIWVNDTTNRLSVTNKRGITIAKET